MKHLAVLLSALFLVTLLFSPVKAQSSVDACEIELSEPFSVVKGKVVRVGNTLVFVDDDLGRSVTVDRSNIKRFSPQKDVSSIDLYRPVIYRERDRLHFEFRVVTPSANCEAIRQWLRNGTSTPGGGGRRTPPRKPQAPVTKYPVVHIRDMARDFSGTLIVSEKTIEFECSQDSGRSRRWALKDVRKVEQRTPYLLMVFPCATDKYTFEFPAKGMDPTVFRPLRNRISQASDCK